MTIQYQQTDTTKTPQAACSGHAVGGTAKARECDVGVSAGSTSTTIGTGNDNRYCWNDISAEVGGDVDWAAGTMTWRLHVTSGDSNFRLEKVYVCRLNSSEVSQEQLGVDTTMNTSMSTGTHTGTITLSAATSPSSTDKFATVFIFDNDSGGHGGASIQVRPSQLIDMPWNYKGSLAVPCRYGMSIPTLLRTR